MPIHRQRAPTRPWTDRSHQVAAGHEGAPAPGRIEVAVLEVRFQRLTAAPLRHAQTSLVESAATRNGNLLPVRFRRRRPRPSVCACFQMSQRFFVLLELELAKSQQSPCRSQPRRIGHYLLKSPRRLRVLVRFVLQRTQVPPAFFPIRLNRESALDIANSLGIFSVLNFGGGSSLQLLNALRRSGLVLTQGLGEKMCGENSWQSQYQKSRPRDPETSSTDGSFACKFRADFRLEWPSRTSPTE